jgi:hypothetical protein
VEIRRSWLLTLDFLDEARFRPVEREERDEVLFLEVVFFVVFRAIFLFKPKDCSNYSTRDYFNRIFQGDFPEIRRRIYATGKPPNPKQAPSQPRPIPRCGKATRSFPA